MCFIHFKTLFFQLTYYKKIRATVFTFQTSEKYKLFNISFSNCSNEPTPCVHIIVIVLYSIPLPPPPTLSKQSSNLLYDIRKISRGLKDETNTVAAKLSACC